MESLKPGSKSLRLVSAAALAATLTMTTALLPVPGGGAAAVAQAKASAKASKQQLNTRTRNLNSRIRALRKKTARLQRELQEQSGEPATPAGPAGGALAGTYPDPTLNVSGGPCADGQALADISPLAVLLCDVGVFSDENDNVGVTANPFPALTTGTSNTAIGTNALSSNTTGTLNLGLGINAGQGLTTGDNNIMIDSAAGSPDESDTIRIGFNQASTFISGIHSAMVDGATDLPVVVDGDGQLGTVASSRRLKTEIRPLLGEGLMKLRPVSFRYRESPVGVHFGLIAEEVAEVLPELVVNDDDGRPAAVRYHELPALLLAKIQDQQRQIEALEADNERLDELEEEVARLSGLVGG